MKKSELRKLIKEELLKEDEINEMQFKKVDTILRDIQKKIFSIQGVDFYKAQANNEYKEFRAQFKKADSELTKLRRIVKALY